MFEVTTQPEFQLFQSERHDPATSDIYWASVHKPWRVDDEYEERFVYDPITGLVLPHSSSYAVCHLIEVIGNSEILPQFEPLLQTHDSYCRVSRLGLELA